MTMAARLLADFGRHGRSGLDHADDRHVRGLLDLRQCQRGCGVAGDHQQVDVLGFEKARRADGVARNRFRRLGAVGQARGVAEIEVVRRQSARPWPSAR